jgi:hypothetical protein
LFIPYNTFEQNVHFVRYMLDKASDEELDSIRMRSEERDALLGKDVEIFQHDDKIECQGAFHPDKSKKKDLTVISYHRRLNTEACYGYQSLDTAAHELFHAAKFWKSNKSPLSKSYNILVNTGYMAFWVNLFIDTPYQGLIGLALPIGMVADTYRGFSKRYSEEVSAHRAGAHFNMEVYQGSGENSFEIDSESKGKMNFYQRIGAYPKNQKILDIYVEAAKECTEGKGFFESERHLISELKGYAYMQDRMHLSKQQQQLVL